MERSSENIKLPILYFCITRYCFGETREVRTSYQSNRFLADVEYNDACIFTPIND